jgi:pimeloyl-ACP methyl ester carboxylesterase
VFYYSNNTIQPVKLYLYLKHLTPKKMLKRIIFFTFILKLTTSVAQGPKDTLFIHYTLSHPRLKTINIHVTKNYDNRKKPMIVYLDGSGNFPIYYKTKSGRYSTSIPLDVKRYAREYFIVLISKPETPFSDSLQYSASGRAYYPEKESFHTLYSLDWRRDAASEAINFLVKQLPVDQNKIIVMGYSEGAQVAPAVAVKNPKVTQVVSFVGNALNQLYDFLIITRLDVERNNITPTEGQRIVDSLYTAFDKIYQDPLSTSKFWYGSTHLKWSSFSTSTPLENMLKLNIPILYIAAGKDNNQTIIDMDYARLEFLRRGKKNLSYKVYPNSNHFFQEEVVEEGVSKKIDRIDEVHQFAIDWLNTQEH